MSFRTTLCTALMVVGIASSAVGRDVSFFVASDTHYGQDQWADNEAANKSAISVMNNLPGTAYSNSTFGNVATPRGVLVAGDLTDSGTSSNWNGYWFFGTRDGFKTDYPVQGGSGSHLHYPVYETYGNHDIGNVVLNGIASRNSSRSTTVNASSNGFHYSWDWDDVHFVSLGVYAGGSGDARDSLSFLQSDLAAHATSNTPIVLMQHYGFDSFSSSWWTTAEKDALYNVIQDYNVVAMFTGHEHWSEQIMWNGIPDFAAPRAKGDNGTDGFYSVRMLDNEMIVAQRRLNGTWGNVWTVDLTGGDGMRMMGMRTFGDTSVPEPGTLALVAIGFLGIFAYARKKRHC